MTVLADMARRRAISLTAMPMTLRRSLRHETILAFSSCWRCSSSPAVRPLLHRRQPAQPGPPDDRGRADRLVMTFVIITGGIDLSVGSILGLRAILLGVFWKNVGLPLPLAIVLAIVVGTLRGLCQRADHHPLPRAAADRHPGDARALSRPRRRHQPGALGARLSGLVLRARPGRVLGVPTQLWICWRSSRSSPRSSSAAPPSAAPPTPSARTRPRRASPGFASTAPSSRSTPPRASLRRWPR